MKQTISLQEFQLLIAYKGMIQQKFDEAEEYYQSALKVIELPDDGKFMGDLGWISDFLYDYKTNLNSVLKRLNIKVKAPDTKHIK